MLVSRARLLFSISVYALGLFQARDEKLVNVRREARNEKQLDEKGERRTHLRRLDVVRSLGKATKEKTRSEKQDALNFEAGHKHLRKRVRARQT